jgi:cysteine desulfurase
VIDAHYFDWNSTTPPAPEVLEAVAAAELQFWGNSSSVHAVGRRARSALEAARESIAGEFGVHPRDLLFTSGGTEANNLALAGRGPLVLSPLEHPSVVKVAERAALEGRSVVWLPVAESGLIAEPALELALASLGSAAALTTVALHAANHETGVIQPLKSLLELCRRFGARVHVDAVQWLGKAELSALGEPDTLAIAAHKLRGPKGIGALLFRGKSPNPVLLGGAQERGLRPGTPNAALAVGFGVAVQRARSGPARYAALAVLRDHFEAALRSVAQVNGDGPRLPHISNLSLRNQPGPELVAALDLAGFSVSSGSACSAGTSEPSPVVAAMCGAERARSAVRVSLGEGHELADVTALLAALFQVLAPLS